jgi:hypothetical protein
LQLAGNVGDVDIKLVGHPVVDDGVIIDIALFKCSTVCISLYIIYKEKK